MKPEDAAKLGSTPVPGNEPAGTAVRYDPDFQKLQAEIDKLESVTAGPVNWAEATATAGAILTGKSKDILVSAYLAMGLFQRSGYAGLAAGLTAFRDLLSTFWEKLFPPIEKLRGREAAVRWLDERISQAVTSRPAASEEDRAQLDSCSSLLKEVAELVAAKFPGGGPSTGELQRAIRDKTESIPRPAAPTEKPDVPVNVARPSEPAVIDTAEKALAKVLEAAAFLRRASTADPLPYRLLRGAFWSRVTALPPQKGGVTTLAGGDANLLRSIEASLAEGAFAAVIEQSEGRLATDPLWLDLTFSTVRALEGLGAGHDAARTAVIEESAGLLGRLRGLPSLQFEGGVFLASPAARLWIENEVLPPAPAADSTPGKLENAMREAKKLVARRQLGAATTLFQKDMQGLPPGRERFLWRLELAKLCTEAGEHRLALPLFESLDEEGRRHTLEEWEPALSVEVVKCLWQCYSALPKGEGVGEKAAQVYSRLCRLDLTAAMALDGGSDRKK